jgi:hypothetical protein
LSLEILSDFFSIHIGCHESNLRLHLSQRADAEEGLPVGRQAEEVEGLLCAEFRRPNLGDIPGQDAHPNSIHEHHRDAIAERHGIPLTDIPSLSVHSDVSIFISEKETNEGK